MHPVTTVDEWALSEQAPNHTSPQILAAPLRRGSLISVGPPCKPVAEIKAGRCTLVAEGQWRHSP